MTELWDVYDENRVKTGRLHRRGEELGAGEWHLIVVVWIRRGDGRYLISRRAADKEPYPLYWENTGGAALAGDSSLDAALREAKEELGIDLDPAKGRLMYEHKRDKSRAFRDVWLFRQDIDIANVVFQQGETCDAKWASADEILSMIADGTFVPAADYAEQLFKEA